MKKTIHTISFTTIGCKLNQSETDAIRTKFIQNDFQVVPFGKTADLTLINTCTVTNNADSDSRAMIRKALRASPDGRIVVTGCYAQIKPQDIESIEGVDLILGNDEKYRIFDYLDRIKDGKLVKPLVYVNDQGDFDKVTEDGFISSTSRTRAFLKIQEGCNYFCSYCIVPFARGRARSRSFNDTITEAKQLVDRGFQEIVLTGVNIGTYHYQNGSSYRMEDLLCGLEKIKGLQRIRVSSIEPNTVSDNLLMLMRDSKVICPHLHIPLQSGADEILKAMNRKYTVADFENLMERYRNLLPDAGLGTDLITGFPGETDKHFEQTLKTIQNAPLTYLHVFRYSERDGTKATKLPNKVDPIIAKKRSQILHETGRMLKLDFYRKHIGKTLKVLFDQEKNGKYSGYSENYIQVFVNSTDNLRNKLHPTKLVELNENGIAMGLLPTA